MRTIMFVHRGVYNHRGLCFHMFRRTNVSDLLPSLFAQLLSEAHIPTHQTPERQKPGFQLDVYVGRVWACGKVCHWISYERADRFE